MAGDPNYHYLATVPTYSGLTYTLMDIEWDPAELLVYVQGYDQQPLTVFVESVMYEVWDESQVITTGGFGEAQQRTAVRMYSATPSQRDYVLRRFREFWPITMTGYDGNSVMTLSGVTQSTIDYETSLTEREGI